MTGWLSWGLSDCIIDSPDRFVCHGDERGNGAACSYRLTAVPAVPIVPVCWAFRSARSRTMHPANVLAPHGRAMTLDAATFALGVAAFG